MKKEIKIWITEFEESGKEDCEVVIEVGLHHQKYEPQTLEYEGDVEGFEPESADFDRTKYTPEEQKIIESYFEYAGKEAVKTLKYK